MVLVNAMHISAKLGIRSNKVWAADLLEENQQAPDSLSSSQEETTAKPA